MKDIEHWKQEGFTFEARFTGEYDLWVNHKTMQKLRRYVDGREWLSDLTTGEYALVQDTPNVAGQGAAKPYPAPAGSASLVSQPPRDVSELYHELLYAVERCFPGESRHETALRYIRETERRVGEAGSCMQNDRA